MSVSYTTWVLGAGFSRSLDGPLLNHFFSPDLDARVRRVAGKVLDADMMRLLRVGYWGGDSPQGYARPQRPWRDPEEFLTFLDAAHADPDSREAGLLRSLGFEREAIGDLRRSARRYVTIATDEFVPDYRVAQRKERWRPYFEWAQRLIDRTDVVATFNYDRVVETASGGRIVPRLPGARATENRPWLLKLHGSVTWRSGTNGIIGDHERTGIELLQNDLDPFLGMPGPSKYEAARNDLLSVWEDALDCIKLARRIVLLGFRFPPGDADARRRLLDAIAANDHPELQVHLVLGPITHDPEVVRVQKLLERAVAGKRGPTEAARRVHVEPLWAEDFIALDDG